MAVVSRFLVGTKPAFPAIDGLPSPQTRPAHREEVIVKNKTNTTRPSCAALILLAAFGHLTGCLYAGDPGHRQVDRAEAASMEGVRIELIRHSTGCNAAESKGLIVEVGPGVEYPASAVRDLEANCSFVPHPGVEVHVEDNAVIFDFSNVTDPGQFPASAFEGYILDVVRTAGAPFLLAAFVDYETTTIDVIQDDLVFDYDRLEINLADRAFDSDSFLKIDLYLAKGSE